MQTVAERGVAAWHAVARDMTEAALDDVLAEDVVFQSPVVHTPQRGRDITKRYLLAAFDVLPGDGSRAEGAPSEASARSFRYVREVVGELDAVLEFMTEVDGIIVNGVDMIRWNDDGKIVDFKVMIRPLKAIQKVHAQMAAMLQRMQASG